MTNPPAKPTVGQVIEVPTFYANGFSFNVSPTDVSFVFLRNGQPDCLLNLSHTTAKSLMNFLKDGLDQIESATGQPIMSAEQASELLEAARHRKTDNREH